MAEPMDLPRFIPDDYEKLFADRRTRALKVAHALCGGQPTRRLQGAQQG